ncbi:hypothetical protein ACFQZI_09560 [Mucilaginibacter lutimaris]|uniref:Lipoprotein n=1 Tax=Mucilaginibacter lutimaris TaxID=931629 RepID=A0ABW2ZG26_9SPHI
MKNTIASFILLFALASCGDSKQHAQKIDTIKTDAVVSSNVPPEPGSEDDIATRIDTTKLLKEYSAKHIFSNLTDKDVFTLRVYGDSLLTSKGLLEVKNSKGDLLYQYRFTTIDLLIDPDSISASEQTTQINGIFKHYFDEDNFESPAISDKQTFEDAFPNFNEADRADWLKVKADKQAVVFRHREGYEGLIGIAYSKVRKKAMMVSYSD